jgi:hypothetical protein
LGAGGEEGSMIRGLWTVALSLTWAGCSCGGAGEQGQPADDGPAGCSDVDADGFGVGADCQGPDCDDSNPAIHLEDQCAALCAENPHGTGCDCDPAADPEPITCYGGAPDTLGVGICAPGLRTCLEDGSWSACEGQRLPIDETCDGIDNDCDGQVDDGLTEGGLDCQNCDDVCEEAGVGAGADTPWDPANEGDRGIVVDADGALTLDSDAAAGSYLWVPSWTEAFIAKIDSTTGEEVARYQFGPDFNTDDPYHVSVSPIGGAVVSTQGTYLNCSGWGGGVGACGAMLTRIGYHPCPDTNGDGVVRTSDRAGDLLDWEEDDCMLWSREYPEVPYGAVVWEERMELDGPVEYIWLADPTNHRILELDEMGEETGTIVDTAPLSPAGMEFAEDGLLYVSDQWSQSNVARVDTEAASAEVFDNGQGQKHTCIAVDTDGQVWIPNDLGLSVFHPETNTYTNLAVPSYGVVADDEGRIWQGGWFDHVFWEYDAESMTQTQQIDLGLPASIGGSGWGDTEDYVYPAITTDGSLFIIDQANNRVLSVDKDNPEDFSDIGVDIPSPGACGDLTGIHRSRIVGPNSGYSHVFEGCAADVTTHWTHVTYDADVPAGANIQFSVRAADTVIDLAAAPYQVIGSAPADASPISILDSLGEQIDGTYAELRVVLSASDIGAPRLFTFGLRHSCQGVIQ